MHSSTFGIRRQITAGRCGSRRQYVLLLAASAAVPGLLAHDARADKYWINSVTSGSWSFAADWNATSVTGAGGAGAPGSNDNVYLTNTTSSTFTIVLNENDTINQLEIGNTGGGSDTLSQTSTFTLDTLAVEYVGYAGTGIFNQSAGNDLIGNVTNPQNLVIGNNASSNGAYSLSGSGSLTTTAWEILGNSGVGAFNQSGGTNTVNEYLVLGNNSTGDGIYEASGTSVLNVLGNEYVGNNGTGTFEQFGGVHTIGTTSSPATFYLGYGSNVSGTYTLTGGTLAVNGPEYVGLSGNGGFYQSGGTHTIGTAASPQPLYIGFYSGSIGNYSLTGGTLTVNGSVFVGSTNNGIGTLLTGSSMAITNSLNISTNGTFSQTTGSFSAASVNQSGGTATLPALNVDSIVNFSTGEVGSYTMSNGSLTVYGAEYVGNSGAGTFTQSGGVHLIGANSPQPLYLGYTNSGSGTYFLSGGSLAAYGGENIGGVATFNGTLFAQGGSGTFNQSGGVNTIGFAASPQALLIDAYGAGQYILSNGTLTVYGPEEIGGYSGAGTFSQSGGVQTIGTTSAPQSLYLGFDGYPGASATGNYLLNGTGSLTISGNSYVGYYGNGTFTQNAGSLTVSGNQYIGLSAIGTFTQGGGSLTVSGSEYVSIGGSGTFTQSGGVHTVGSTLSPQNLSIGNSSNGTGNYLLSNGSLTVTGVEYVGNGGAGIFTQTGGVHTVGPTSSQQPLYVNLYIGNGAGSPGTYNLSGNGSLTVGGSEIVGYQGTGTFNQTGGVNLIGSASDVQFLAVGAGGITYGQGTYVLSGGTLNTSDEEVGGTTGSGTFNQSGGFNTTYTLYVGGSNSNTGRFTLSGSGNLSVYDEEIGNGSDGTFTQSGGVQVANSITLGTAGNANYLFSGGTITVNGDELVASNESASTFTQTGGVQIIGTAASPQELDIAASGGFFANSGTYLLSGTGSLTVNGNVYVGGTGLSAGGTGVLDVSGGSMLVSNTLKIFDTPGTKASLSGGQLAVGSIDTSGNPADFSWTGGTLTFLNGVTINPNFFFGSSVDLSTGLTLGSGTTFINDGQITLSGGGISSVGLLTNQTSITGNGTISSQGGLANYGQITQSGGNLAVNVPTYGFSNYANLTLATGFQLQLSGSALYNYGVVQLNSGFVNGTASVINKAGAEIVGPGSINNSFQNSGIVVVPSGLTELPSFTNNGLIQMASSSGLLGGGFTITNSATIQGYGTVSDGVINNSTIEALGGALVLTGGVTNSSTGLINAGDGCEVLMLGGTNFPSNAGSISLSGGTFDNGGGALSNTGTISGYGTFRAGGWSNSGKMDFSSGSTGVYGAVTNTGTIIVTGGSASTFYNNFTTSSGTVGITTASTAVLFGTVIGQSNITGAGTVDFEGNSAGGALANIAGNLIVGPSAVVSANYLQENAAQISGSLSINANGTSAALSTINSLTIAGGTLDLRNNDLIVTNSGQLPAVQAAITSAYNSGAWNGSGITSSSAATHPNFYGLGYATAGAIGTTSFDGQSVASGTTLVKYTLLGDALLTGTVGLGDYNIVQANLNTGTLWTQGAFHPGSTTGLADYNAVIANFNQTAMGTVAGASIKSAVHSESIAAPTAAGDLSLEVNTTSGDVYALALAATALTGYDIYDKSASFLDSGDPNTDLNERLLSQPSSAITGNQTQFRNATNYKLWVTILDNTSTLAEGQNNGKLKQGTASTYDTINIPAGGTIDFGDIYSTADNNKDLTFSFSEADPTNGGNPVTGSTYNGVVTYVGVPEPTTLGLLGLGGVTVMRRRRKLSAAVIIGSGGATA